MIWSLPSCNKQQKWKCFLGVHQWRSGLCGLELIDVRVAPDWFEICVVCVQPALPKEVITLTSYIPPTAAHSQTHQCNISFPFFFHFCISILLISWLSLLHEVNKSDCSTTVNYISHVYLYDKPSVHFSGCHCQLPDKHLASRGFSNFIMKCSAAGLQHGDCPVLM